LIPQQLDAFIKEKTSCIVGIKTMERFGWKIGDRITLQGTIWDCSPELIIRGVYREGIDETNLFFHHDYFDDLLGGLNLVGTFWIKVANAEAVQSVIDRIDATFRNTDAETKTETERAFQLGFISMFGNIKMLIGSICTVVVFTMILVTASTMSMAIRERMREIAVLKAIGFNTRHVFGLILAESFGLAMVGGLIGCGGRPSAVRPHGHLQSHPGVLHQIRGDRAHPERGPAAGCLAGRGELSGPRRGLCAHVRGDGLEGDGLTWPPSPSATTCAACVCAGG
jgi:hypothetical protein